MIIKSEAYFIVPLYQKKENETIIISKLLMEYYTSPMARCIECVSGCEIPWYSSIEKLNKSAVESGSIFVVLDDFNDNNRVKKSKQIEDYKQNYKNSYFYNLLKENNLINDVNLDIYNTERKK